MPSLHAPSRFVMILALLTTAGPACAAAADFDPSQIDLVDAIECRLDAPSYNGFALSIEGDDGIAKQRHWRRIASGNPFMNEYDLPQPIAVAGHFVTQRIAFTASAVLAIVDLADPAEIAQPLGIANAMDPDPLIEAIVASGNATRAEVEAQTRFHKFLGEKIVSETSVLPAPAESFGAHTVVTRNVSNATTHPGKTFYGCSYRVELIGKDGKPL